jgi:hypothetical protein
MWLRVAEEWLEQRVTTDMWLAVCGALQKAESLAAGSLMRRRPHLCSVCRQALQAGLQEASGSKRKQPEGGAAAGGGGRPAGTKKGMLDSMLGELSSSEEEEEDEAK